MKGNLFRQVICVVLALMMFGCKSTYDLVLSSTPSGVAVEVGPDLYGRTPCNLEIPKNSKLIRDHHINVKYTLDNGREVVKSYDLKDYEPPSKFATAGGLIFAGPGGLLFWLSLPEDDNSASFSDDEDEPYWPGLGVGLGLMGIGVLTYLALGGNLDAQWQYEIHESLEEIAALPEN